MIHFKESKIHSEGIQTVYVDIDETICFYKKNRRYDLAVPNKNNIEKINTLYNKGWHVVYWTARGASSGIDYFDFTLGQLNKWGCKYHRLICGKDKGSFDLVIDDKAIRIEELEDKKIIGFTCSAFDLLHPGHILMLKDCKNVCDYLIVGLQTDPTIDRKNKNKPIQTLEERKIMIESVKYVDEVRIYETEKDLVNLIKKVSPNIRIIGSDWERNKITGGELNIPLYIHKRDHDYSTTNLRKRLINNEK